MLMVGKTNRTTVPATIVVRDEAGRQTKVDIKLTGLVRRQTDWDELFGRHGAVAAEAKVTEIYQANARLFAEVFDGWEGVADADGQPLPYSADAVEVLLVSEHGPAANAALMKALNELRFGALEKN